MRLRFVSLMATIAMTATPLLVATHAQASAYSARNVYCDFSSNPKRVEVIYAVAADRPDRYATVKEAIQTAVHDMDVNSFDASAHATGAHRHLRFVHYMVSERTGGRGSFPTISCLPAVTKVLMDQAADDDSTAAVRTELTRQGFNRSDRKYLVFVDAPRSAPFCDGNRPVDDRKVANNAANSGPHWAVVGPGTTGEMGSGCWHAQAAAHEVMHTLGGVQVSAPHSTPMGHTNEKYDRMAYESGVTFVYRCGAMGNATDIARYGPLFDCNHDDYFYAGTPPAGNYLATHWNTADSDFLIKP